MRVSIGELTEGVAHLIEREYPRDRKLEFPGDVHAGVLRRATGTLHYRIARQTGEAVLSHDAFPDATASISPYAHRMTLHRTRPDTSALLSALGREGAGVTQMPVWQRRGSAMFSGQRWLPLLSSREVPPHTLSPLISERSARDAYGRSTRT